MFKIQVTLESISANTSHKPFNSASVCVIGVADNHDWILIRIYMPCTVYTSE